MAVQSHTVRFHLIPFYKNTLFAIALVVGLIGLLWAQNAAAGSGLRVKFFAAQSSVPSSGLSYPYRVAVDASGNVYISDTQANKVLKETLANGVYTESTIVSTGLATPYGIAVDVSGNVYIVDNGHNRVVKETPSGNSYTQTVVSTTTALSFPSGIAVDASGTLYIADTGGGKILVEAPSGGSYTETALTYSSNFAQITGIAVDSSGNIYVTDIDNQAVYMETYSAGSYTPSTIATSGLNYPYDITVDGAGNLYISDFSNKRIVLETYVSPGTYTQSVLPTATLGGALGVTWGGDGNLYIADTFGFNIKELNWSAGNSGQVNVNSSSGPVSMLYQFYGGSVSATLSLSGTQVVTQGIPSLDFTDATTGNCSTSTAYTAGQFCWVNVRFTPMYPGVRLGGVQLLGASNAILATGYVSGIGVGPQVNYYYPEFSFSTVNPIAGPPYYDLTEPFAAVVDANGDVFIADYSNNAVYEETLSAGNYTQSTVVTGLNNPEAVALDGAGNVYVVDSGNDQILVESFVNGSWVQSIVAIELNFPTGIAVDAQGSVYYSSFNDGAVYKLTQLNGVYSDPTTVASGLNQPRKIAVDAYGNVYIADTGNNRVVKETLTAGSYTQSVIGSSMQYPYAVAVAADGTVFVADTGHDQILAEIWADGSYTQSVQIPGPVAFDIQVDQAGNLIFPEVDEIVFLINYVQSPSLNFADTYIGNTSSDSPQTAGIINVGNANLSISVPGSGTNPSISLGYALATDNESDCPAVASGGSASTLAPGVGCFLPVSFEPVVAGSDNGSVSIVTNSLNTSTTAMVNLSGNGLELDTTATALQVTPATIQSGGTVNITASVTDTSVPDTTPTGSVTFTDTLGTTTTNLNGGSAVTLTAGVASLTGVTLTGIGTHVITASYGGVSISSVTLNTSSSSATVLAEPSSNVGTATTSFPITLTVTTAGTLANIKVLTQGATGLDFTDAGDGDTCTVENEYVIGNTCTVDLVFTPTAPGLRSGAVVLVDGSGNVLAESYLSGIATGPELTFATLVSGNYLPKSESIASGFSQVTGVAYDGAGNLYVADSGAYKVYQLAPGCTTLSCAVQLASGFTFGETQNLAIDGAGDVIVADESGFVRRIVAASGYNTVVNLGGGYNSPSGVAVAPNGDVFVADKNNKKVYEIPSACSHGVNDASCVVTLAPSFSFGIPYELAIDAAENVYVADLTSSNIREITAASGYTTVNPLGSGLNAPFGVTVDSAGDVYVADDGNQAVKEFVAVSGSVPASPTILLLGTGYHNPIGVAVDSQGNLAVADNGTFTADRLDFHDPPALTYQATGVNNTSTDSPQTVVVSNLGNATLTFGESGVAPPTDFPLSASSEGECADGANLVAGSSCTLPIGFTPLSQGNKSETLTLTDNNLNVTSATQLIALSGDVIPILFTSPSSTTLTAGNVGVTYPAVTFVASGGTAPYAYTVISGSLPAGLVLSTAGVLTGIPTAGGSFSFTVKATDSASVSGTQTYSITINPATITLSPSTSTLTAGIYGASYSQSITAAGGTSSYSYSESGTLPPGLTFTTAGLLAGTPTTVGGPYSFTVTATDSSTGTGPYTGSQAYSLTIGKATATVTIAPASLTQVYTGSPLAVSTTTVPASLAVVCTYTGINGTTYAASTTAPTAAGTYTVSCAVDTTDYVGVATGTFEIISFTVTPVGGGSGGGSGSVITTPGSSVTNSINVSLSNGSTLPVAALLTVAGLPTGATATVAPTTWAQQTSNTWLLPANATLGQVTLTIQLPTTTASSNRSNDTHSKLPQILWGLLLLPLAGWMRRSGKRLNRIGRTLLLCLCALSGLVAVSGLSSCGSGSGYFGQAQQSYTVTETITAGASTQSTSFILTVE